LPSGELYTDEKSINNNLDNLGKAREDKNALGSKTQRVKKGLFE